MSVVNSRSLLTNMVSSTEVTDRRPPTLCVTSVAFENSVHTVGVPSNSVGPLIDEENDDPSADPGRSVQAVVDLGSHEVIRAAHIHGSTMQGFAGMSLTGLAC